MRNLIVRLQTEFIPCFTSTLYVPNKLYSNCTLQFPNNLCTCTSTLSRNAPPTPMRGLIPRTVFRSPLYLHVYTLNTCMLPPCEGTHLMRPAAGLPALQSPPPSVADRSKDRWHSHMFTSDQSGTSHSLFVVCGILYAYLGKSH